MKTWRGRMTGFTASVAIAALALAVSPAVADPIPPGGIASNLEVIGFTGLNGRPGAFKIVPHQKNGKWYIYAGHSFDQGWSIIDVTDPTNPRYVKFIPYKTPTKGVVTAQVTLHGDIMITAIDKESKPDPALIIWDISDPENPKQLSTWKGAEGGSHRNTYPGGKYAYIAGFAEGYHGKGHEVIILDVSDPKHPKQVGVLAQPGQKDGEKLPPDHQPGFHGPVNVSPDGKMATFGFAPDVVNADISDPANPKFIGKLTMSPPFMYAGNQTVHTGLPLWDRKLIYASSEASQWGCDKDGMNWAAMIDNKDPAHPRLMSIFPHPLPPPGAPYKDFCDKGGRFGPHNVVMEQHNPDVHPTGNTLYITWFNAGLRSWDISDPYQPTNVGYFLPPENPKAAAHEGPHAAPNDWMEDVTQDTRGYIYADDYKWGIGLLRDPNAK